MLWFRSAKAEKIFQAPSKQLFLVMALVCCFLSRRQGLANAKSQHWTNSPSYKRRIPQIIFHPQSALFGMVHIKRVRDSQISKGNKNIYCARGDWWLQAPRSCCMPIIQMSCGAQVGSQQIPVYFHYWGRNPKAMKSRTPVWLTCISLSDWRNEPCCDKGCWPSDFNHMRSCNCCPGEHGLKHPIASMKWNLVIGVREKAVQFEH